MLKTRNEKCEVDCASYQFGKTKNGQDGIYTPKPYMGNNEYEEIKNDAVKFSDDATLKTNGAGEI